MYGGNLRLKIDWASLILGRKFTVFLCFTLYLSVISKYKPPGGLIFGGAYLWRGLFSEFYGISTAHSLSCGEVAIDIKCTCSKGVYEIHCTSSTCVCQQSLTLIAGYF